MKKSERKDLIMRGDFKLSVELKSLFIAIFPPIPSLLPLPPMPQKTENLKNKHVRGIPNS